MLIDEYNSLQPSEEDRIKEPQQDMQLVFAANEVDAEIYTAVKGLKELSLKGQAVKFTLHDDMSLYAYNFEAQSLIVLAERHRQLPIIKLKQTVVLSSENKSLRKHTTGIQSEETNIKIYVPMYFEIFEEICEYTTWSILHSKNQSQIMKPAEQFYQGNSKKALLSDLALLEVAVGNLSLNILFNESLVYLLHFEDITNVPNCPFNTPYVSDIL